MDAFMFTKVGITLALAVMVIPLGLAMFFDGKLRTWMLLDGGFLKCFFVGVVLFIISFIGHVFFGL